jgi:hypothetical protein
MKIFCILLRWSVPKNRQSRDEIPLGAGILRRVGLNFPADMLMNTLQQMMQPPQPPPRPGAQASAFRKPQPRMKVVK